MNPEAAVADIVAVGRRFDARNLAAATSGNFSIRLDAGRIAVTVSGRHKGRLRAEDVMTVDADGRPLSEQRPSAETVLHTGIYRRYPDTRAVLHWHSVAAVAVTRLLAASPRITFEGYEMLKAFPGISSHETRIEIPVFENSQDVAALAHCIDAQLAAQPSPPAYLLRGHGAYAWGRSLEEAERISEALEHLLACELAVRSAHSAQHPRLLEAES